MAEPAAKKSYARELTALAVAPAAIWITGWAPPMVFVVTLTIIALLALWELLTMGRKKAYPIQRPVCLALMLLIVVACVHPDISLELGVYATLLVVPALYIFSGREIENALPATAVSVLGTLYVGMLAGALIRLRIDFGNIDGPRLVFFLLIVVWIGDAGAYYVGKRFGKHRLSPRISPKKTIEGGIGGVVVSLIAATVIHFTFFRNFALVHALPIALVLSVAGVVGDLAESLWKRSADVKDSSGLIPGHGGFLDRFDSILFTAPILYAYWYLLVHDFKLS